MKNKSTLIYALLLLLAISAVVFMAYIFIGTYHNTPITSLVPSVPTKQPTASPTLAYLNTIKQGGAVAKTISATTIDYLLYGHIVSIDSEDTQGLHCHFVFQGDPLNNSVPIIILNHGQVYKLLLYTQGFGQQSMLDQADAALMRKTITQTVSTIELRVPFLKNPMSKANINLMNSFDAVSQGDWTKLTKAVLLVDSIGVSKAP